MAPTSACRTWRCGSPPVAPRLTLPARANGASSSSRGWWIYRRWLRAPNKPPLDEPGADQGGGEMLEGFDGVGPALVAAREPAEVGSGGGPSSSASAKQPASATAAGTSRAG